MTEKRLSLPDAVKLLDGPCNQIIRYHCLAGNMSYEKQRGHIFIKESDLKRWYEIYKDGGYPVGPKSIKYDYNAKPDVVFIANEA